MPWLSEGSYPEFFFRAACARDVESFVALYDGTKYRDDYERFTRRFGDTDVRTPRFGRLPIVSTRRRLREQPERAG